MGMQRAGSLTLAWSGWSSRPPEWKLESDGQRLLQVWRHGSLIGCFSNTPQTIRNRLQWPKIQAPVMSRLAIRGGTNACSNVSEFRHRRPNIKPIEQGNNTTGRMGKLRCQPCRKRKSKVLYHRFCLWKSWPNFSVIILLKIRLATAASCAILQSYVSNNGDPKRIRWTIQIWCYHDR